MKTGLVVIVITVWGLGCIESPSESSGSLPDASGSVDSGARDSSASKFCENCELQLVDQESDIQLSPVSCGVGEANFIGTRLYASSLDKRPGEAGVRCDGFRLSRVGDRTFELVQTEAFTEVGHGTTGQREYSSCESGVLVGADIHNLDGVFSISAICAEPILEVSESMNGELTTNLIVGETSESPQIPNECDDVDCDSLRKLCTDGKIMNGVAVGGPAGEDGLPSSVRRFDILCVRPVVD